MAKRLSALGPLWGAIVGWGILTLLLAFFIQSRDFYGASPILRPALQVQEAFQAEVTGVAEREASASTGLEKPREPYTLLNSWLTPKTVEEASDPRAGWNPPGRAVDLPDSFYGTAVADVYKETKTSPRPAFTAQTCWESDFQTRLEKTGNYRQLTNNYKRGTPDSCSAPLQDTALGYYKVDPLPAGGCLSPKEWGTATLKSDVRG